MIPTKTQVLGKECDWTEDILREWETRIMPRFKNGDWCSTANYFAPRPYVDEYNRGSDYWGFTYVVEPGNRVCQETWKRL